MMLVTGQIKQGVYQAITLKKSIILDQIAFQWTEGVLHNCLANVIFLMLFVCLVRAAYAKGKGILYFPWSQPCGHRIALVHR